MYELNIPNRKSSLEYNCTVFLKMSALFLFTPYWKHATETCSYSDFYAIFFPHCFKASKLFPNATVEVHMRTNEAPRLTIMPGNMTGHFAGNMEFWVKSKTCSKNMFTLSTVSATLIILYPTKIFARIYSAYYMLIRLYY